MLQLRNIGVILTIVACPICSIAQNSFRVRVNRQGTTPLDYFYDTSGRVDVPSLPVTTTSVAITGWSNGDFDNTQSIGRVVLTGGPSSSVDVVVGITLVTTDSSSPGAALNLVGVDMSGITAGATVRFGGAVLGNVTGTINGADELYRFDANGADSNIAGTIVASSSNGFAIVESARITGSVGLVSGTLTRVKTRTGDLSGTVQVDNGSISSVEVAGNLTGSILAPSGSITSVVVTGDINIPLSGPPSFAPGIGASSGITTITASSISARISAQWNGSVNTGTGQVGRIATTSGGWTSGSLFSAGINTSGGTNGIYLSGPLNTNLNFSAPLNKPITATGFTAGRTMTVTGCIDPNCTLNFGSGEFAGTINIVPGVSPLVGAFEGDLICGTFSGNLTSASHATSTSSISVASVTSSGVIQIGTGSSEAFVSGTLTCAGTFAGALSSNNQATASSTITLGSMAAGSSIDIGGFFNGSLAVSGAMNGRIRIADHLYNSISIGSSGLGGQVIINRKNSAATWLGPVTVGSIVLDDSSSSPDTAPYYERTSSALGGGAVGLVPFNLHREDSTPAHNAYKRLNQFSASNPICVAYYGSVQRRTGTSESLLATIEYHVPYSPLDDSSGDWMPADTCFIVDVDSGNARRLKVEPNPSFPPHPGLYRLSATGDLVCGDVPSAPAVQNRTYWFWLALDCNGNGIADSDDFTPNNDDTGDCNHNGVSDCCDIAQGGFPGSGCTLPPEFCDGSCVCNFNDDEYLNSQDFFDFLTCFFGGGCPDGRSADINNDSFVNSQDFFDFLTCFFAGCQ